MALFENLSTLEIAQTLAPEFKICDEEVLAVLNMYLTFHAACLPAEKYGDAWRFAVALRALHDATLSLQISQSGTSGTTAVISERAGEIARSYATPATTGSSADEYLRRTPYGQKFLELRDSLAATHFSYSLYGWVF